MAKTLLIFLIVSVVTLPLSVTGCGGSKKSAAKKDYGKPVWLKVDESKFAKLSEDATNLENGTVTVYDPEGWERLSRGAVKAPKGFKSVIVFKKSGATLMMTKSQDAKDLPDLDEDNIEEFADGAQQKFKSPVKMVKLGDKVGVYFSRRVADAQRLSKYYDRRIVATTINGGLFTYELIADQGKINESLQNALFAVIFKTQFENSTPEENTTDVIPLEIAKETAKEPKEEAKPVTPEPTVAATELTAAKPVAPEPVAAEKKEEKKTTEEQKPITVAEAKPETKPKPPEVAVAKPAATEEKSAEKTPELAATSGSPEKKPDTKKPAAKKPTAKKGNTKDILNELDALLN
jgi:hypothetical protein